MHELNASVFLKLLWDSKKSKINKTVSCKPYEEGGMNMLDVFGILSAMKSIWLRKRSALKIVTTLYFGGYVSRA